MEENKRQRQKRETRIKILNCAAAVFAEKGFTVPTTDVSKKAGISHGALFVHFATREELIDSTVCVFFEELNTQIHEAARTTTDIRNLLDIHLSVLQENERFYRNLIIQPGSLPETARKKMIASQATLALHFEQIMSKEIEGGDIPLYMMFNMWIGLVHYYLQNYDMFAPEGSVIRRYRNELRDTYLALVRKESEK